ncbi:DUF2789 domain-containing protein [Halopseudomonas pachastrellae]|uniref:DUF2789 domain-containing protein n=1 Tax=Halopseudomonas pachastrellae TaxID=254161 RepID=UPI003D7D9C9C|tara:strand:+ start:860 stop:1093 length:234 start_codon:yes stop_codon:yes gene_type:complete
MELHNKDLGTLFEQLGLDSDQESIDAFFASHSLAHDTKLSEAPFWTPAQAAFLREEIREDAEWAPLVDELNARLHEQ